MTQSRSIPSPASRGTCGSRPRWTAARSREAWSSRTMFRGMELILKGRDPRDAWVFAQRICGVCTTVHALASVRAVENALGVTPPHNARLLRNLIIGARSTSRTTWSTSTTCTRSTGWTSTRRAQGRPGEDRALAQSHLGLAAKSSTDLLHGRPERVKRFVEQRPARALRQRLLGPPCLQAAAGGEPDGGRPLPRGAGLAARGHQDPRRPRRQEPAPAELTWSAAWPPRWTPTARPRINAERARPHARG